MCNSHLKEGACAGEAYSREIMCNGATPQVRGLMDVQRMCNAMCNGATQKGSAGALPFLSR